MNRKKVKSLKDRKKDEGREGGREGRKKKGGEKF